MWWKLIALATATIVASVCFIPIRSHAVKYEPGEQAQRPPRPSLRQVFGNMYLTRGTLALIAIILAIATVVAFEIVRAA